MDTDVLDSAVRLTETIRATNRRHPFERAVRDFVRLLATVPDYPAHDFSAGAIDVLNTLAGQVIDRIEHRLDAEADPGADRQKLAGAVYEIRRLLEQVNRWRSHYLRPPGART